MVEAPRVSRSDLVEIAGVVRRETDAAWLFHDGFRECWLPKSLCDWEPKRTGAVLDNGVMTMPEWLATKEGFI